jgi:3-dehydroquinate synthetase/shikimate kinase
MSDVILVGLPGSGKSSVGRLVAQATDRAFLDLDEEFARVHGTSAADFIETRGEGAFRTAEARIVRGAVARSADAQSTATGGGTVFATGGGTVIDPISRWLLWHAGPVVWLDAPDEVLLARLAAHEIRRPLSPDAATLARRRAERERYYRTADLTVSGDLEPHSAAETVLGWLRDNPAAPTARVLLDDRVRRDHPMGPREARILLGDRLAHSSLAGLVTTNSTGVPVVVVDENVMAAQPHLVEAFPAARRLLIDAGEANKRLAAAEAMLEFAAEKRAERGDAWVAIGGGTTGDLVGTAAALYMRGAPLIQVPTTWLAMSDAAIGGKVAVDLSAAKNSAGAFWPPVAVVGDVAVLATLSRDRRLDGMGECLKSGIIGDPWLWELIRERGDAALADGDEADLAARYAMVERSAVLKLGVVDRDPFEAGERRTLNLGHTIGHALEIESRYTLPHGQAVVLGTRAVAHMAVARGLAEAELANEIDDVVASLGFATHRAFDPGVMKRALTGDKKVKAGRLRWILPEAIGRVTQVDDVTEAEVDAALAHIREA